MNADSPFIFQGRASKINIVSSDTGFGLTPGPEIEVEQRLTINNNGAITGAIAEAYYGVPEDIKDNALSYLDEDLRAIYDEWGEFIALQN